MAKFLQAERLRNLFRGRAASEAVAPGAAPGLGQNVAEGLLGVPLRLAMEKPSIGIPALGLGGLFGYEIGEGVAHSLGSTRRARQQRYEDHGTWLHRKAQEAELARLERDAVRSAARLAAADPQMYNEVLAGRRLPRGARVFGGRPRIDLLEQLAYSMARGEFQEQAPGAALMAAAGVQPGAGGPGGI